MSKINSEILEVKNLIEDVNNLLNSQKTALLETSTALATYAKNAKLPSDFSKTMKSINEQNLALIENNTKLIKLDVEAQRLANLKIDNQKKILALSEAQARADKKSIDQAEAKIKTAQKETEATKEQQTAYEKLVQAHKKVSKELKDLVIASLKSENSSQQLTDKIKVQTKELADLNQQLASAEFSTKKYAVGAKSSATSVDLFIEKQKALKKELAETNKLTDAENTRFDKLNRQDRVANAKKIGTRSDEINEINAYYKALEKETAEKEKNSKATNKLTDAYGILSIQRNEVARALQNSIIETGKSSQQTKLLTKDFEVLDKKIEMADKAIGKFSQSNNGIRTLATSVNYLMTAFGIGTGIDILVDLGKSIFTITKEFNSLNLALKNVTETDKNFLQQQGFIAGISDKYGIELQGITKEFTKFYSSAKDKLSSSKIQNIFESISNAGANMGLSIEEQEGAFLALEQMMSKGTVQSEELRGQLGERLPGAFEIAQKAYQKLHPEIDTTNKFMGEMKKGLVQSAELLPVLAKEFEIAYGIENRDRVDTLSSSINRIKNSWSNWVLGLSSDNAVVKVTIGLFNGLANNLDKVITTIGVGVGALGAWKTATYLAVLQTRLLTLATVQNTVSITANSITTSRGVTFTLASTSATLAQTTAQTANTVATNFARVAWVRLNTVMKANILGIAVTGLIALVWWLDKTKDSALKSSKAVGEVSDKFIKERVAIKQNTEGVQEMITAYDTLHGKKVRTKEEQERLNEVTKALAKQYPDSVMAMDKYGGAIALSTKTISLYNRVKKDQLELDKKDLIQKESLSIKTLFKDLQEKLQLQKEWETSLNVYRTDTKKTSQTINVIERLKRESNELRLNISLSRDRLALLKGEPVTTKTPDSLPYNPVTDEQTEAQKEKARKAIEDSHKERDRLAEEDYKARLSDLERKKQLQEYFLEDETKWNKAKLKDFELGVDFRIKKSKELFESDKSIALLNYNEKKRLIDLEAKERNLSSGAKGNLLKPVKNDFDTANDKALQDYTKRTASYYKDFYDSMDYLEKDNPIRLPGQWSKEQIKEAKDAQKKRKEELDDANKQKIEDEKDRIKLFNDHVGGFLKEAGFAKSADLFVKLDKNGKTMWERLAKSAEKGKERYKDVFIGITTIAQDAYNKIAESSMQKYEYEKNILDKQKEDALEYAGESDEAKKKIEEQYAERQREIRRKEFKATQEQAIVNIAINTAQAIMMGYGQTGPIAGSAFAILMGAIGVAQIALVSSQEMPEYWTGTDNAKEGLALTQERGQEIITNKYGVVKDFGDGKGARVTKMDAGDKVFNAQKTREMLFKEELSDVLQLNGINFHNIVEKKGLTASEMKNIMVETMGGRPTLSLNIDENGFNIASQRNGNITRRAERRGHGKGIEFK